MGKKKSILASLGEGENTFLPAFKIKDGESVESRNISTNSYPSLSPRTGRRLTYGGANGKVQGFNVTTTGTAQHTYQEDTIWKAFDGVSHTNIQTGLTNKRSVIKTFNIGVTGTGSTVTTASYSETNQSAGQNLYSGAYTSCGQVFIPSSDVRIATCKFYLKKSGSPTGNVVARLYEVTGTAGITAVPIGIALSTSGNLDVSTLTTSYQLITFTFTNEYLISGTNYAVVLEYSGGDASNYLIVGYDDTGTGTGNAVRYDGTWAYYSTNTAATSAGTGADSSEVGTVAWSNPGNITSSDNSYATANLVAPSTVDSYNTVNSESSLSTGFESYGFGQSFTCDSSAVLVSCRFYLKKAGSPTYSAKAVLYAHSGTYGTSGIPTGAALATSDIFDVATLTTNYQLITFNFSGINQYQMIAGTHYVIMITNVGGETSNTLIGKADSAGTHDGNGVTRSLSGYSASNKDLLFFVLTNGATTATSHYLKSTNFGFSIPTNSTILGIKAEIEKKQDATTSDTYDSAVKIIKADGSIGTTNKADANEWSTTESYTTYGSTTDLWGETWTAENINDADFGVALSATGNGIASVDHVRITIYYALPYDFCFYVTGTRVNSSGMSFLMNGIDKYTWDGATVTNLTNAPVSKVYTVHKERVFIATGKKVTYSALALVNDYTTANDAGNFFVTNGAGDITGLISYNDNLIILTNSSMHIMFGVIPSEFRVVDVDGQIGCLNGETISIGDDGMLRWLGNNEKVYEYAGAKAYVISEPFGSNGVDGGIPTYLKTLCNNSALYNLASGGSVTNYYYLTVTDGTNAYNNLLLAYDTKLKKWYPQSGNFVFLDTSANKLSGVDINNKVWDIQYYGYDETGTDVGDTTTNIDWYFISKKFSNDFAGKTTLSELWVVFDLSPYGSLTVSARSNVNTTWTEVYASGTSTADYTNQRIQIPYNMIQNVDWYQFKIAGSGMCKAHFLEKVLRVR